MRWRYCSVSEILAYCLASLADSQFADGRWGTECPSQLNGLSLRGVDFRADTETKYHLVVNKKNLCKRHIYSGLFGKVLQREELSQDLLNSTISQAESVLNHPKTGKQNAFLQPDPLIHELCTIIKHGLFNLMTNISSPPIFIPATFTKPDDNLITNQLLELYCEKGDALVSSYLQVNHFGNKDILYISRCITRQNVGPKERHLMLKKIPNFSIRLPFYVVLLPPRNSTFHCYGRMKFSWARRKKKKKKRKKIPFVEYAQNFSQLIVEQTLKLFFDCCHLKMHAFCHGRKCGTDTLLEGHSDYFFIRIIYISSKCGLLCKPNHCGSPFISQEIANCRVDVKIAYCVSASLPVSLHFLHATEKEITDTSRDWAARKSGRKTCMNLRLSDALLASRIHSSRWSQIQWNGINECLNFVNGKKHLPHMTFPPRLPNLSHFTNLGPH
ncbi:hypothetical protein EGR_08241 [Echinococcus granulosus]|uniref:Uncharacterized protein n=1 Tax=Echinococcus granulosus TaxID=6210 RepID=W6UU23_ECHGR|nr:hypothetical protein EGR_08241 [Echinococcus granulosus]EUB56889.1 hypothetical protein EGR_08241 [Echinococcus granulosus]